MAGAADFAIASRAGPRSPSGNRSQTWKKFKARFRFYRKRAFYIDCARLPDRKSRVANQTAAISAQQTIALHTVLQRP